MSFSEWSEVSEDIARLRNQVKQIALERDRLRELLTDARKYLPHVMIHKSQIQNIGPIDSSLCDRIDAELAKWE